MTAATLAPPITPAGTPGVTVLRQMAKRYDGPDNIGDDLRTAAAIASAREAIPPMYRNSPGDVLVLMYQARALDIAIATALQKIVFHRGQNGGPSSGKSGMSGELMLGLIIRAGHKVEVIAATDSVVEMRLHRCDDQPSGTAKWTITEAAVAGLATRDVWKAYPGDLLYWRCLSRLARRYAADVVQGFGYTPEEVASLTIDDVTDSPTQEERPVDPDVQAFLADLDVLDHAAVRELWKKARKNGLSDQYAGTLDGQPFTVEHLLATVAERRRLGEEAEAEALAKATAMLDVFTPAPEPGTAVEDQLAGTGTLPCGCDSATVVMTGQHACADELAADQPEPEPEPAPADDLAIDDDEGADLLVRMLDCGCHPFAVEIAGHRNDCQERDRVGAGV